MTKISRRTACLTGMTLGLFFVSGCKTTEGPPVSETPPRRQPTSRPAQPASCETRVKTLMTWVDRLLADRSPISLHSSRLELVEREGSPVRVFGPVLELEYRGGKPLLGMVAFNLDQTLINHKYLATRVNPGPGAGVSPSPPASQDTSKDLVPWYIAADRRLRWAVVAYLAHLAPKKKLDTFRFVFWDRERAPAPPPSSIDSTVRALMEKYDTMVDPSAPAVLLKPGPAKPHARIAALFARCPGVQLSLRFRHQPAQLREDLAKQLRACDCKMEIPGLQAWLRFQLVWADRSGPKSLVSVRLAGPKTPNALELTLPAERPWQLAYKDLLQAVKRAKGRPLRLLAR